MRLLFLLMIITQLLAVNTGHGLDLYDVEAWVGEGRKKVRPQVNAAEEPNIVQQTIAPVNEEGFSLTRIISSGFNQMKPALPIIAYLVFRYIQGCPGDCPIE